MFGFAESVESLIATASEFVTQFGAWSADDLNRDHPIDENEYLEPKTWPSLLARLGDDSIDVLRYRNLAIRHLFRFGDSLAKQSTEEIRQTSYARGCDFTPAWIGRVRVALDRVSEIPDDHSSSGSINWVPGVQPRWLVNSRGETDRRVLPALLKRLTCPWKHSQAEPANR